MPENDTIFQLVYASAATAPFNDEDLKQLLAQARAKNSRLGVTGMLLYQDGSFIQALEGDRETVLALYETILGDPRHTASMLLYQGETNERSFEEWSMGFQRLHAGEARSIPGLSDFLQGGPATVSAEQGQKIRSILIGFREGRWHRHAS